jgi:hypothetical protein
MYLCIVWYGVLNVVIRRWIKKKYIYIYIYIYIERERERDFAGNESEGIFC